LFQPSCHIFVAKKEEKNDNLSSEGENLRNWDHKTSYDEYPSQSEDETEECIFPSTSDCDEIPYQSPISLEDKAQFHQATKIKCHVSRWERWKLKKVKHP
jgi:hypothetical protein